jgi:hypothetical protein
VAAGHNVTVHADVTVGGVGDSDGRP